MAMSEKEIKELISKHYDINVDKENNFLVVKNRFYCRRYIFYVPFRQD